MSAIVIDASVALKWLVEEPDSDLTVARSLESETRIAPDYLLMECAYVIWKKVGQKQLTHRTGEEIIDSLNTLPITFHATYRLITLSYKLAVELNCSVYDCSYLALALNYQCPVVTADKRFYNAVSKSALHDYVQLW